MILLRRSSPDVDLVFDGHCGFCTRAALWLQRADRHGRVQIHPLQRAGVLERFGLTEDEALSAAWAYRSTTGGEASVRAAVPYRGAAAVSLALDAVFGTRLFSTFYRVPGVWWVQDRVYQWVADHRYLLKGVTPWCAQHPEDCADAAAGEGMSCTIAR